MTNQEKKRSKVPAWIIVFFISGVLLGSLICQSCTAGGGVIQCALPSVNTEGL